MKKDLLIELNNKVILGKENFKLESNIVDEVKLFLHQNIHQVFVM